MKTKINGYRAKINKTTDNIKENLCEYFKEHFHEELLPNNKDDIQIISVNQESDLEKVTTSPGLYIILTDHKFNENECSFIYNKHTAIYRGHSYSIKNRVKSHLMHNSYQENKNKWATNYTVCLKIEDGVNGINIDSKPYNGWEWTVIVLKMPNSNKIIREQAELAFDTVFNKPCKSKEKKKEKILL